MALEGEEVEISTSNTFPKNQWDSWSIPVGEQHLGLYQGIYPSLMGSNMGRGAVDKIKNERTYKIDKLSVWSRTISSH